MSPGLAYRFLLLGISLALAGCSTTVPIKVWDEKYPGDDVYSISKSYNTDQMTVDKIRELALERAREFAESKGKDFEILEEEKGVNTFKGEKQERAETLTTLKIIFRLIDQHT